jgi:hypothetical protein
MTHPGNSLLGPPQITGGKKSERNGPFRRNPLMTPLPPSVIRMEWTA